MDILGTRRDVLTSIGIQVENGNLSSCRTWYVVPRYGDSESNGCNDTQDGLTSKDPSRKTLRHRVYYGLTVTSVFDQEMTLSRTYSLIVPAKFLKVISWICVLFRVPVPFGFGPTCKQPVRGRIAVTRGLLRTPWSQ